MGLSTLVCIVAVIVAGVFLLKFLGKAVSFALSVLGVAAVVWLTVAGLRYLDEQKVREGILESNNLFLLSENGKVVTGFATQEGMPEPDIDKAQRELSNPNSPLYSDYYKIIVVKEEALPEDRTEDISSSLGESKEKAFRQYVDTNLLEGDALTNLVGLEKEGAIAVYEESIAFRHGIKEVLMP
jgi:hypothetical protein